MRVSGLKYGYRKDKLKATLIVLLLAGATTLFAQVAAKHSHPYDEAKRLEWIDKSIEYLAKVSNDEQLPIAAFNAYELEGGATVQRLRVMKEARVEFANGDRISFISNSSHDDEQVGDICVAMDHQGKIFFNEGHVCGGLINFENNASVAPKSSAEFFRNFKSGTDNKPWKAYRRLQNIQ